MPHDDAGQPPREQLIAALERVDDDDLVGEVERHLERLRQAALDAGLHDQPIDDDVDVVVAAAIELDVLVERSELTVDARLGEAALAQRLQLLLELALAAAHDRRQHVDAGVGRVEHHQVENALERLRRDLAAAVVAVRRADVGEEQPQVVVDLGDGADGRARVRAGGLLLDRDRRRQALDQIDVRLLHLLEKLPGVGRQRLDIAPLPFGVDRVEGERRLARPGQAGDDHQLIPGQIDVDVLEVVNAGAAHRDPVVRHTVQSGISWRLRNHHFTTGGSREPATVKMCRSADRQAGSRSSARRLAVDVPARRCECPVAVERVDQPRRWRARCRTAPTPCAAGPTSCTGTRPLRAA